MLKYKTHSKTESDLKRQFNFLVGLIYFMLRKFTYNTRYNEGSLHTVNDTMKEVYIQ